MFFQGLKPPQSQIHEFICAVITECLPCERCRGRIVKIKKSDVFLNFCCHEGVDRKTV